MGPPPAFTAPWPADAFAPLFSDKPRVTSQSLVEDEDGDNSERLSKLPPARLEAAAGWDNEIVRSYLLDDDYSDYRGPLFTCMLVTSVFMAVTGLLWGWMARKIMVDGVSYKLRPDPQSTHCLIPPTSQCSDTSQHVYFWNITNPREVLQGAPPALQEVGPYVFDTTLVNYNIQYLPADALGPDRVQWSTLSFSDFSLSKSCSTCADLNATIYGANLLFASTMERVGWNDANLLLQFVPATLTQLLNQMAQSVSQFVSQQPGLTALFPKLGTDPPQHLALEQWANCGALNGMTIQSLGIASLAALMPTPPEFCAWAQLYMGTSPTDAALPTSTAAQIVALMNSNPSFVVQMTSTPPEILAVLMNVTTMQAQLLVGYVEYMSFTYAKSGLLGFLGPPLGPASGGPIIGRTVYQWVYGWRDPLLELVAASPKPHWWSFDPLLQFQFRPTSEQSRWLDLATAVGNGTAPSGAAKRFQTWVMATGRENDASLFRAGNILADNGATSIVHPGGSIPVTGRQISNTGFGNMAKMPFGLDFHSPTYVYFGAAALGADPQLDIGLGRVVPLTWDGVPAGPYMSVPGVRYVLPEDATTPCTNASSASSAPFSSLLAMTQAAQACITGDYIAGVWNLSAPGTYLPLYLTLPHYLHADPAMAASLGPGASAMQPNASKHAMQVVADTMLGIPIDAFVGMQTVIGMKPTAVLFPSLYHGAPGPGGYTFLPNGWTASVFKLNVRTTFLLYTGYYATVSNPRILAGTISMFASITAAFSGWFLFKVRRRSGESTQHTFRLTKIREGDKKSTSDSRAASETSTGSQGVGVSMLSSTL